MKRGDSSSLEKKFKQLEEGTPEQKVQVDSDLGKKGYYNSEGEETTLGKGGFYSKDKKGINFHLPHIEPSQLMPFIILLLAVVVIGGIVFFKPVQTSNFNVVVLSGEAKLANAVVTVYDGATVVSTATTDANGVAVFQNLPNKVLRFTVTSSVGTVERTFNPGGRSVFSFNVAGGVIGLQGDSFTVIVLQEGNRQPVVGAKVSYALGSNNERFVINTSESGKAVIQLNGETIIRIRVVDPQGRFESVGLTIQVGKDSREILLKPKQQTIANLAAIQNTTTSIDVLVRDANGNPIDSGTVTAFYTFTGGEAASAPIANGRAELSNLSVGALVSFTVNADGFYSSQSGQVLVSTDLQPVLVSLVPIPASAPKTRFVLFANTLPVDGEVHVFQKGNLTKLFSIVSVNGSIETDLQEGTYYALVTASGYLASTTQEFNAGQEVKVDLIAISPETASNLEVNVTDEDNALVQGASVVVLNSDGLLAALPLETQFGTSVNFNLPINSIVVVRAALGSLEVEQNVDLSQVNSINVQLLTHAAFLDLHVKNLQDDSLVQSTLTSFYNGVVYQTCTGNGGCVIPVRGESDVAVKVDAIGYLPYTYYSSPLAERTSKTADVKLVESSMVGQVNAELLSIVNSNGQVVSGNVLRPGAYVAKFYAAGKQAEQLSFYVRINDGKQNASLSSIYLNEPLSSDYIDVAKSNIYSGPKPLCVDLTDSPTAQPYKWVELTFADTSSQEVNIPFTISDSTKENTSFTFEYRAKAVSGGLHARFPADPDLSFDAASPRKANCYAETTSAGGRFTVARNQAPIIENVLPVVAGQITTGDALVFDPVQRTLRSQNGLSSYDLQVDSILPGDAMPLELQQDAQCTVIVKQPNTTVKTSNAPCYYYDENQKALVFASQELNPSCPIHLQGDKFYSGTGTRVTTDSIELTVLASCSPQVSLNIPITVKFISDVSTLTIAPEEGQLGEGDAAKLLYLINNRQLQRRVVQTEFQTSTPSLNSFQLPGASAKALAWRGPGQLDFSENDNLLQEIIYENPARNAFKPGVGILSHRQTTCAVGDVNCCANGWCTKKALDDLMNTFKEQAMQTASRTALRRGNGQPLSYFSQTPFKFVTVVQATQGSQQALTVQGVNFSSPVTCLPGNPGVYELTASSTTGREGEWNYSAKTLQLTSSDYIQAASQCGGSGVNNVTQSSFTGAKGDVALCNFLSAKNNCIESTPKALITSIDQVEKLEFELTNCMYPVFPGAPVCPGTHMVLPAINLGNWKTETSFDPSDSPNAFKKIWTAVSDSNSSSFTAFSWEGQLKCVVPPSFQQFAISAAASGLDLAEDEVKNERAPPERTSPSITNSVCNREGFFNLGVVPNLETIIPLAGVCCPTQVTAEICTPRRGKFFINVKDNVIKISTQWGLTEKCYPYWPFPTDLQGLLQKHNLVSVAFGLTEFISSNGANFEMSLASETPGDKPVAVTGLTNKQCSGDGDCTNNYEECAVNKIYSYSGGKCVSGVCSYSTTNEKLTCSGGQTCEQASGSAPTCNACGGDGQPCCVESANNAFCSAGFGCLIDGSSAQCTSACGNSNQPVCGGWNSRVEPCKDGTSIHDADSVHPYSYCK